MHWGSSRTNSSDLRFEKRLQTILAGEYEGLEAVRVARGESRGSYYYIAAGARVGYPQGVRLFTPFVGGESHLG